MSMQSVSTPNDIFDLILVNIVGDNLMAKRKGEKHKRVKCSTLAKLMTESAYEESIYNLNENGSQQDQMSY